MIKLIINADDFGMSKVFNEKIIELLENGLVKSTTVMVNRINEVQRNQVKKLIVLNNKKQISVGLHLEFDLNNSIKEQIEEQFEKFVFLFGFKPSHLDIHKLIDNKQVIKEVDEFAFQKGLPVRNHGFKTKARTTSYPSFLITHKPKEEIFSFLNKMKEGESYELITHPGKFDINCKSSWNEVRKEDFEKIIQINKYIKQKPKIKIVSYKQL